MQLSSNDNKEDLFLHFRNGVPQRLMTPAEVQAILPAPAAAPTPVTPDVTKPSTAARVAALLGPQVGTRDGSPVFLAKTGDHYYEQLSTGVLLPRGTNLSFSPTGPASPLAVGLNPSPVRGGQGVPTRYTLPIGWGWTSFPSDGAWYVVPAVTAEAGPGWLLATPGTPDATKPITEPTTVTDWNSQSA